MDVVPSGIEQLPDAALPAVPRAFDTGKKRHATQLESRARTTAGATANRGSVLAVTSARLFRVIVSWFASGNCNGSIGPIRIFRDRRHADLSSNATLADDPVWE